MALNRGIVLTPNLKYDPKEQSLTGTFGLDPDLLRHAILYFDRIDRPANNIVDSDDPDINFLQAAGVAQRTRVEIWGTIDAGSFVKATFQAYKQLCVAEPGRWTLGQAAASLFAPHGLLEEAHTIEVTLNSTLPTPPSDIPLNDLLEFKQQRSDEYVALRNTVDELYQGTMQAGDGLRASDAAKDRLEKAIRDISSVCHPSWKARIRGAVKFNFDPAKLWPSFIAGSSAEAVGHWAASLHIPELAAATGIAFATWHQLTIDYKKLLKPKELPDSLAPYAYLLHAESEFPGTLPRT